MFSASLVLLLQLQIPAPVGYVNDFAGVLDTESQRTMQLLIDEVRDKSGGEIVVVTLSDLGGGASIDVARDIIRTWKIGATGAAGDRARNAGVVLLLKPGARPGDGQAELAVGTGTGAEGFITDAFAGRVRDAVGRASVEQGSYAAGLVTGVTLLAQAYAAEFGFELTGAPAIADDQPGAVPTGFGFLATLLIIMFIAMMISGGRRGRRGGGLAQALLWSMLLGGRRGGHGHWGGGGFGGGGGGFGGFGGGGGSMGGGASGRF